MAVTPAMIEAVRVEIQDVDPALPILPDSTITYFLEKHSENIQQASLDAARAVLMRLSMDSADEVVDILSLKGSKAAEQYRLSLELYLKNPLLNPVYQTAKGWIGGTSNKDIESTYVDPDQNYVRVPAKEYPPDTTKSFFSV